MRIIMLKVSGLDCKQLDSPSSMSVGLWVGVALSA